MRSTCNMWKSLRTSVRDLLELRVGFAAKKKSHDAKVQGRLACLVPSRRPCCILRCWDADGHANSHRTSHQGANDSHESQEGQDGSNPQWNQGIPVGHYWAETFGWSTAVAVGWYLSQPFNWHILFGQRRYQQRRCGDWWQRLAARSNPLGMAVLSDSIGLPVGLPSSTESGGSFSSLTSSSDRALSGSSDTIDSPDAADEWSSRRGPFTPLEALDEASREFAAMSRKREAHVENEVGLRYMADGRHHRALRHFRRASYLDHDHAAYNLGQCYELGLGVERSIRKAAKWYKIAAQRGHSTAMYNVGVFYAHGWGGLPANASEAHKCFLAASKLGHAEAQTALKMVETSSADDVSSQVSLNGVPSPTAVLLDMLGVSVEKKPILAVKASPGSDPRVECRVDALHWLDLSVPVGKASPKPGSPDGSAWQSFTDENLVATCRKFLDKVQCSLSFANGPSTEAAL